MAASSSTGGCARTIHVHAATTGNDRDADADDSSLVKINQPSSLSRLLFGGVGIGEWLLWLVECFLFSYLLPTEMDVAASMNSFVPLAKLMAEQIAALKQWSVGRARRSTSSTPAASLKTRKLGV